MSICQYCHRQHDGKYASGRFCSQRCSSKSRRKNRAKTIAKKKKLGTYKKHYTPTVSKLQLGVIKILKDAGLKVQTQFQLGKYYYDIKIGNLICQINGTYWHFDPRIYSGDQIVSVPGNKKIRVSTKWKKDVKKKLQATNRGYKVIQLWQNDIHAMSPSEIVQFFTTNLLQG